MGSPPPGRVCQPPESERSGLAQRSPRLCPHSSGDTDRTVPLPVGGLSYIQGLTRQRLISKTVGQCLEAIAQRVPDREALVVPQENVRLTFAQLKEEVGPDLEPLTSAGARLRAALAGWSSEGRARLRGRVRGAA